MIKTQIEECLELINSIKDALGTEENGDALVEVARNAHKAEVKLASVYRIAQENEHSQILSALIIDTIDEA